MKLCLQTLIWYSDIGSNAEDCVCRKLCFLQLSCCHLGSGFISSFRAQSRFCKAWAGRGLLQQLTLLFSFVSDLERAFK